MGLGVGIFLIAVGAILTWAVHAHVSGLNVVAIGVILLVLGIVVFFLDVLWWRSWTWAVPWQRTTYVDGAPVARPSGWWPRRRVVVDEDIRGPGPGPPGPGPPPP